jgi:hypothetical protein
MPSPWSCKVALGALLITGAGAYAQAPSQPAQPYSGLETREIKALSAEDIAGLTIGRGMGLALPAELNGYPGPLHVLELADQLGLSGEQREKVRLGFEAMKSEAIPLGHKLIAAERDLDRDFANRTITPKRLKAATAEIGAIRGELRNTHLKYHLTTAALLSPEQIRRYGELRGYGQGGTTSNAPTDPMHNRMHDRLQERVSGPKL